MASDAKLSELIPMHHSEEAIRSYLATLRTRLDINLPHRRLQKGSAPLDLRYQPNFRPFSRD
jgi:hypothetical protein